MNPARVRALAPRPSTGSVRVQELSQPGLHNPCPQSRGADRQGAGHSEWLMEEYLSPARLQALAQADDLLTVTVLEMCVDTRRNSLGNLGLHLPSLRQLKLNGSRLTSVRDLGTSLGHLQVLWLSCCGLPDLDGMGSFPALKELYVSYNSISNLSPLCLLEQLEVLDLEGNRVEELGQVCYLKLCPKLATLTLEGNLVCLRPSPASKAPPHYDYRAEVRQLLPQLQVLDEAPATQTGLPATQTLIQDWLLVKEVISVGNSPDSLLPRLGQPQGAPVQQQAPMLSLPEPRPWPSSPWPLSSLLPGDALPEGLLPEDPASEDDASDLTHGAGHVLCGNPTKGLRQWRRQCQAWAPPERLHRQAALSAITSAPTLDTADSADRLALAELRTWRELCQQGGPCQALMVAEGPGLRSRREHSFLPSPDPSTLPCRHMASPKEGTAAPQGPRRCPEQQEDGSGPRAAPGAPGLAPEPLGTSGCKLIPSPPKHPPPESGISSWSSTEQSFRGRRLRGLGQALAAVRSLRALEVASAPQPAPGATSRPPVRAALSPHHPSPVPPLV